MRLPLHISVCLLIAFASISFASGCRTPRLQIETPGDASGYRTWDFVDPLRDVIQIMHRPGR